MAKTKTIEMIGYYVSGTLNVSLWGGDKGDIEIKPIVINNPNMTLETVKEIIPNGINDNGFGVESFNYAILDIFELYEYDVKIMVEASVHFDNIKTVNISI